MKTMIILGDQLFDLSYFDSYKNILVFMSEDVGLCTHYKYHKHKIMFFLLSMRRFAQKLKDNKFHLEYYELNENSFFYNLLEFTKKNGVTELVMYEISDLFFQKEVLEFSKKNNLKITFVSSPMFLCSKVEFSKYLKSTKKPLMKTFYERERKRLKILVDDNNKPQGGKWSFDTENRKKVPKVLTNKKNTHLAPRDKIFIEVQKTVDDYFSSHPGDTKDFWLGTTHEEAKQSLGFFIQHHLIDFGDYQDAMTNKDPFLYHSILSPYINNGLLLPHVVVNEVLKKSNASLNSTEGFIRQVIGWREFVKGIYDNFHSQQWESNFFGHHRKLTHQWYEGTTGIEPVDDAIKKALKYGYGHHIERLMVVSNFMLLCEIHPHEVYRWFMEMYVDSADWVMGPNVFGMGQFSDGGIFATKPYFSGSNYILKMSDYKKGPWCDIWDGLFWRFIGKHQEFFKKNIRLNFMVTTLQKMQIDRVKTLNKSADTFLSQFTHLN